MRRIRVRILRENKIILHDFRYFCGKLLQEINPGRATSVDDVTSQT